MDYPSAALVVAATILGVVASIIYDGVERKLRATLQSRIGPPIHQTLLDIAKLWSKEVKEFPSYPLILYMTILAAILAATIILVLNLILAGVSVAMSMPLVIALIAVSQATSISIPLLVPNPYSQIGGMREVMLALVNEFSLITGLTLFYYLVMANTPLTPYTVIVATPLAILILVSTYVFTGRIPFDIAEAEVELASGILIELSGKALALYMLTIYMKRYIASLLVAAMIVMPLPLSGLSKLVLGNLLTPVAWIAYSLPSVILGRSRVDMAPGTLFKIYILLILLSITGLLVIK